MRRPRLGWYILTFSMLTLLVQWFRFLFPFRYRLETIGHIPLFHIFFGFLSLCCVVMFFSISKKFFYIAWGTFVLVFFIFNNFFSSLSLIPFSLALLCLLHIALYEYFPINLLLACIFSVLSAVSLRSDLLFLPDRSNLSILLFGDLDYLIFCLTVSIVSCLMIHYREKLISMQSEFRILNNAMYELTRANLKYQDYAQEARERSMEQERQRLTRDIHDIVGYALTNAMMMTQSGKVMLKNDPDKLPKHFDAIRESLSECMEQIRLALRNLRSFPVSNPKGFTAISRLAKIFSTATQIHVRLEYGNADWHFDEKVSDIIYHFIQEGLINSFRHGKPSAIRILFHKERKWTKINILDNGKGTDGFHEGIGIAGMKERVEAIGGRLEIVTALDGFSISIYIPNKGHQKNACETD